MSIASAQTKDVTPLSYSAPLSWAKSAPGWTKQSSSVSEVKPDRSETPGIDILTARLPGDKVSYV